MITIPGQLAIKTIHGRNGDFNVGRLQTSIGAFKVKDAELDQYGEGKYEGEFIIANIFSTSYAIPGGMIIETRAQLGGMTLSGINRLSKDEAHQLSPQEVDPIEEERVVAQPVTAAPTTPPLAEEPSSPSKNPLADDTPFPIKPVKSAKTAHQDPAAAAAASDDAALFGDLWPLSEVFKLDTTVDRRRLRQQRDRLYALGYEFEELRQEWQRKAA